MNIGLLTILSALTLLIAVIWHYTHPAVKVSFIKGKTMNMKAFIIMWAIATFIGLVLDNWNGGEANTVGIWTIILGIALAIAIVATIIERLPEPRLRLSVHQRRLFEEIEDFIPWQEPEGTRRIVRNLKALNRDGFHAFNLQGAFLQNADLFGLDLRGSNLQTADLRGANLVGTNLAGANLEGAQFTQGASIVIPPNSPNRRMIVRGFERIYEISEDDYRRIFLSGEYDFNEVLKYIKEYDQHRVEAAE